MKEQKSKPYIIENWLYNGLNIEQDVWRIEISIKSDASTTIRTSTGEIFRLSADNLCLQDMVEDIFFSYAEKYFSFKHNDGKKNKTRMPDVMIFPEKRTRTLHPIRITNEKDSTRADRIFLKKLYSLFKEFKYMDRQTWEALKEVTNAFKVSRNLASWSSKNLMVESYHTSYEAAAAKFFQDDLQNTLQRLLERHPKGAEYIHELTTLIFKILKS